MPFEKGWAHDLSRAVELTLRLLRSRESSRDASTRSDTSVAEAIRSAAHGSTAQELVAGFLEVQKARMALQLALFAAAVTLTAAAFQLTNSVLFLVAGAVVPLAWLSDYITKRNTLSPLLYRLARLEIDTGAEEPLAVLFVAFDRRGFDRFRLLLAPGDGGESRIRFRRHFLRRGLPFRLFFYGGIFASEVVLAWVFRHWMPSLPVDGLWRSVVGLVA